MGRNKSSRQKRSWGLTEVVRLVLKCPGASGCFPQERLSGLWGLSVSLLVWNCVSENLCKALFWWKETLAYLLTRTSPVLAVFSSPSYSCSVVPIHSSAIRSCLPASYIHSENTLRDSPLCHTVLMFVREATSTLELGRQMCYLSIMFKTWTPARLASAWKGRQQMVSLLSLLLWYNPVSAMSFSEAQLCQSGISPRQAWLWWSCGFRHVLHSCSSKAEGVCEQSRTGIPFGLKQS